MFILYVVLCYQYDKYLLNDTLCVAKGSKGSSEMQRKIKKGDALQGFNMNEVYEKDWEALFKYLESGSSEMVYLH